MKDQFLVTEEKMSYQFLIDYVEDKINTQHLEITEERVSISKGEVMYFVDWDRIETIKEWCSHLISQWWMTTELLVDFVVAWQYFNKNY